VPTGSPRAGSAASSPATAWRGNKPSSRVPDAPTTHRPRSPRRPSPCSSSCAATWRREASTPAPRPSPGTSLTSTIGTSLPPTISRYLTRHGLVVPTPSKRPKSSYTSFQADLPNECWQADFTHYALTCPDGTPGADTEILTWLDDCSRYALRVTAHAVVTGPLVVASFRQAVADHGVPASTLTDNGMVFTTRFSGGKGGRNGLEAELRRLNVHQKNSSPNHPTTCGKVERFQQTMKKWLRAQPQQATSLDQLQDMLGAFVLLYNQQRPHRSLPHRATPAAVYHTRPKTAPLASRELDHHRRIRHDVIDATGKVTLRVAGRLLHIGVGRTHARTPVVLLVQDLDVRVVDAATGELLRALTLDPSRSYQPTGRGPGPSPR
jgi:transposase InsO family protein